MKKDFLSLFSANILSKVISGVYTILLIQLLSVDEYALFTNFQAIYSFMGGFIFSAFNYGLIKYTAEKLYKTKENPAEVYIKVLFVNTLVYAPMLLAALFFSDNISHILFHNHTFSSSVKYGVIAGFGLIISNTVLSIYQAEENFKKYNFFSLLRSILILIVLLILFLFKIYTFKQIALSLFWVQTCLSIYYLYLTFSHHGLVFESNYKELWSFLKNIKYLLVYFATYSIYEQMGVFILSRYSNEFELANFGIAFRYYYLTIMLLLSAINVILLPKFSKSEAQNESGYEKKFAVRWIKNTWWIILPILLAMVFGKPVYVFINSKYEYSYSLFCVFSIGTYFSLVFGSLTNVLIGKGLYKYLFYSLLTMLSFNVIICYFFVKDFGALAVTISTVITFNVSFHLLVLRKIFYI